MSKKVWLITGAGRGLGVDVARAVLASGHSVVASGRDRERVSKVLGTSSDLLAVTLDVTNTGDAEAAVRAAVDRFGRIDVLVNNAASFYAGYFEELTPEQINQQLAASLIGPMNVTRAILPVMRKQRSGYIISISSTAGLDSYEFCSAYSASKFGLEGWMAALHSEVAPYGITTTVVNPGFFRTELLSEESTQYAAASIEDYAERCDLGMQRLHPALEAELRGGVGGHELEAGGEARRRGDRDDVSRPLRAHHRQDRAGDVHRADEADRQLALELGRR